LKGPLDRIFESLERHDNEADVLPVPPAAAEDPQSNPAIHSDEKQHFRPGHDRPDNKPRATKPSSGGEGGKGETGVSDAGRPGWKQNASIKNYMLFCPRCGSIEVIGKGKKTGKRWQCKKCGYKFRRLRTELTPDEVKVIETLFDSGGSITRTLNNLKRMGIPLTEGQLRGLTIRIGNNCRFTVGIAKEAGVKRGILLVDGAKYKMRGDEIPQLLAVDVKPTGGRAPLIVNDTFARETLDDARTFVSQIVTIGYRPDPFVIIDDTSVFERPAREYFGDSIQACPIHFGRNVVEAKLPDDLECTDFQLAVKWLIRRVLFTKANSKKRYVKALDKTKEYRDKLREMLRRADQQSASVIRSFLQRFNQLTLHLGYGTRYCDTNPLDMVVRLVKKPIKHGIRQMEDKEFVKAIIRLSVMRYDASVLGVKDWVRWSQKKEIRERKTGKPRPESNTS
jgi:ribosomal protein S27AE